MTLYDNTSGNINRKVLLSGVWDPERPSLKDPFLVNSPKGYMGSSNITVAGAGSQAQPQHWQDTISDFVMTKNMGQGAIDGSVSTSDRRSTADLTIANEFELDINSLTHNFQTLTALLPMPGMPQRTEQVSGRRTAQLNTFSIDLGMMRETISVQGIIVDRANHPSSNSGHHLRRQHLLDIIRTQYAFIHGLNRNKEDTWMNINRFPALTIGPMYGRTAGNDQNYEGDQPSDDPRGIEYSGTAPSTWYAMDDGIANQSGHAGLGIGVKSEFDPTPNYKGRNRYRGLLTRVSVKNVGGRPDIWDYSFEFVVIKNEMQMRMV